MKKTILLFTGLLASWCFGQTIPTPVYHHSFSESLSADNFTVSTTKISLDTDRNEEANKSAKLEADHGAIKLTPTSSHFNNLRSSGTISMWYKHEGTGASAFGSDKPLVYWSNKQTFYQEALLFALTNDGKVKVASYVSTNPNGNGHSASQVGGEFPTSDFGWNHFTLTWNMGTNGYIRAYVNGKKIIDTAAPIFAIPSTSSPDIYFTGFSDTHSSSLYGNIDEIKVFTQVLDDSQIAKMFAQEIPTFCEVNIPDTNFKNALANHHLTNNYPKVDLNGDGKIQCMEAKVYNSTLMLTKKNISDLTGIETFTMLGGLAAGENNLTNVDISNNKRLNQINVGLNQLTSLNVANGNNTKFIAMLAYFNPNLTCIQVDSIASTSTWTNHNFDSRSKYSENCSGTMAVSDINKKQIMLSPNPTAGMVKLSEKADVQVFDTSGRLIGSYKNVESVDLSNQKQGVYILKLNNANGTQSTKVIKK